MNVHRKANFLTRQNYSTIARSRRKPQEKKIYVVK